MELASAGASDATVEPSNEIPPTTVSGPDSIEAGREEPVVSGRVSRVVPHSFAVTAGPPGLAFVGNAGAASRVAGGGERVAARGRTFAVAGYCHNRGNQVNTGWRRVGGPAFGLPA